MKTLSTLFAESVSDELEIRTEAQLLTFIQNLQNGMSGVSSTRIQYKLRVLRSEYYVS